MGNGKLQRDRRSGDSTVIAAKRGGGDSFKDTAESIVIAFVLAFVFRAFVVEAFVIPTGSMASSLYGKHGTLVCQDCGFENVYGLTDLGTRQPQYDSSARVYCRNCNHANTNLVIHDGGRRNKRSSGGGSNAQSGDRILVFKWLLDFGGAEVAANRWDVTVFKNPSEPTENFIKRLVGLPDEVIEIIDGDAFSVPRSELTESTLAELEKLRHIKYRLRSGLPVSAGERGQLASPAPKAVLDELANKLQVCRKTEAAQQSLWLNVYNHDYPPAVLDPRQPYWEPLKPESGDGWNSNDRRLTIKGGRASIQFAGTPIIDRNSYNIWAHARQFDFVSDVRIECVVLPHSGDGSVEFSLGKHDDEFILRLHADGRVILTRKTGTFSQVLDELLLAPFAPEKPFEVAFEIVDYRVAAYVDGLQVFASTAEQYAPDIRALRDNHRGRASSPPRIHADDLDLEMLHVTLLRDVFYTAPRFDSRSEVGAWASAGWGTVGHPIMLREGEYFMMGDNSPASKDSRLWDETGPHLVERGEEFQLGTVPEDQLVGQAFFVYWPAGLRPDWLPMVGQYGVIPNVGQMRWIR